MSRIPAIRLLAGLLVLLLFAADIQSQERPRRGGRGDRPDSGGAPGGADESGDKDGPKPYDEVVTDKFTTSAGLFLVHRNEDKVLYEIPGTTLGTDLLWVTQIAKTQSGFGYGGTSVGNRVVRWEKRGDEILLRDVQYRIRAGETGGVAKSVAATSVMPIIQSFPVLAWGKDQAAVIDVTDVFMGDLPEFSAKRNLDASGVDSKRSYLESVKAFPENIETSVMMTYRLNSSSGAPSGGGRRGPFPGGGSRRDPTQGAVTVELHHSMVKLPARPMVPRKYDDRVGFFGVSFEEYDGQEHEVETVRYITRWRLEKKDPAAAVSDPVKPITFYVGRGVPDKWRPYVHQGIEMWKPAFEAAGFSNAIQALDPPSEREDPDWDAEDARISSIRWLPSTVENAMGPHVHDPRTGEILEADILMFHNVIKLARDWYFVQASPNDPRAQKLPLPDEIIGEALAYVVAHEVGHSLGFPHNMKASSSFTVEQLRDAEFTAKNGTEASIMDYGRFNYVAQPGDGARLIPTIGPYDYFAAEWGYREYASAEAEAEGLKALTARQKENVVLRFGDPNPGEDPSQQTEDLGSDAIEATTLGLKNIDRVASYLVEACCNEGENYDLLENMYGQLVGQRDRELMHVASVVGGFVKGNLWYGDADQVYNSVDPLRQREAIRFLQENAFHAPASLIDPAITLRLEADGAADRILRGQSRILSSLMSDDRIKRMAEHATRDGVNAYRPVEMLRDVTSGIWAELGEADVKVDLYRRNLQRTHANLLAEKLEDPEVDSDMPGLSRGELKLLLEAVSAGLSRAADEETRAHLEDMKARIRQALDPRLEFEPETDGALPAGLRR